MADQIEQTGIEVKRLVREFFGIGDTEVETLMRLAKQCARTSGVPLAGAGGVALAGTSAVVLPLVGSVPGYVAGALAGFVGGTTACMIARRSNAEHVRRILGRAEMSEPQFRHEVLRLLSRAQGMAGYRSAKA